MIHLPDLTIYDGTCHPIYDQVMKRPDQVKKTVRSNISDARL